MPREQITTKSNTVSIGWGRPGFVQVGTLPTGAEITAGWFVDLDRDEINRLIRTLRKARDQAYGSDA